MVPHHVLFWTSQQVQDKCFHLLLWENSIIQEWMLKVTCQMNKGWNRALWSWGLSMLPSLMSPLYLSCFQSRQSFIKFWQQWVSGCQGFRWGDHNDVQPGGRRGHIIFSFLWESTPQPGDMLGLRARKIWVLKTVVPEKAGHNLLATVLGESRAIL